MIKGAIFALALVAGLVVLANAQQKDASYFRDQIKEIHAKMGKGAPSFANGLAIGLQSSCSQTDLKSFAEDLSNASTNGYKCAVDALARPEVLIKVLHRLPHQAESTTQFLDSIRSTSEDQGTIKKLADQGKELCQQYIGEVSPFLTEASKTEYADSKIFARMSLAKSACEFYLRVGVTKEAVVDLGKRANELHGVMNSNN